MIELLTLLLLFGALLYRIGIGLFSIGIISALTSAFFFSYFLSRKGLCYGLGICTAMMLGAIVMNAHTIKIDQSFFTDRTITATIQSVDRRLDKTVLVVQDQHYKKLIQVTIHTQSTLLPGDEVSVLGTVQRPEDFETDTGRIFPYQQYLLSKDIVGVMPAASVTLVSRGSFSIARFAAITRFSIADVLRKYIAFPIDGIVAGMIVGYQGGIPDTIQNLFRTTGVLHVLVLSGENITLLAVFLGILLRPLPLYVRIILTSCAIVFVVWISGTGVSAIRAGVMGIVALSATVVRRTYVPFRALTISVLCFFLYSPESIFSDPGFHLSVLATICMIMVMPKIERYFYWLPERYKIRELVLLALVVPLCMLPYTMYFSGLEPLAAPFANIVMAMMTSVIMLSGAAVLAVSWMPPIATVIGILISFVGNSVIALLKLLNTLPQLNTPPLAWWGVVMSYGLFFIVLFRTDLMQWWHGLRLQLQNGAPLLTNSSATENQ